MVFLLSRGFIKGVVHLKSVLANYLKKIPLTNAEQYLKMKSFRFVTRRMWLQTRACSAGL